MKTTLALLAACTLTACVTAQQRPYDPNLAQCEYEASSATANIDNVFTQAIERSRLIDMCLKAKSGRG